MNSATVLSCAKAFPDKTFKEAVADMQKHEDGFEVNQYVHIYGSGVILPGTASVSPQKYTTVSVIAEMMEELRISKETAEAAFRKACHKRNRDKVDDKSEMAKTLKGVIGEQKPGPVSPKCKMEIEIEELSQAIMAKRLGVSMKKPRSRVA